MGEGNFLYGMNNFHLTLKSIEGYRNQVLQEDEYVQAYVEAISGVAKQWAPVKVGLCGLTASAGGVLVQGWPRSDLQALRASLHERLAATGLPSWGPEAKGSNIRKTAHAAISIFKDSIENPGEVISYVENNRTTQFSEESFGELWLVGYRRTRTSVDLIEYECIEFSGFNC